MADPGQFTLNSDGQFFLNADGSWAVLNGAGECPACCGGGGVSACSKSQYNFTRTWVCERNGLQYTQDMLNAWSDNFTWEEGPFGQNGLAGPPCANYLRYTSNIWSTRATTAMSPAFFGGPGQGYGGGTYWLWNGGGPSIQVDASISFNRSVFIQSGNYAPVGEFLVYAFGTVAGVADSELSLGRVQCVFAGGANPSALWIDGVDTGDVVTQDTPIRIQSTGSWVRLDSLSVQFMRTAIFTIAGNVYTRTYQSRIYNWPETMSPSLPELCLCQPRILAATSPVLVFDDLSIAVINPFEPV